MLNYAQKTSVAHCICEFQAQFHVILISPTLDLQDEPTLLHPSLHVSLLLIFRFVCGQEFIT